MGNLITEDWGLVDYAEAWERQEFLFHQKIEQKQRGESATVDRIVFCEHPHVYTLGRSGKIMALDSWFVTPFLIWNIFILG